MSILLCPVWSDLPSDPHPNRRLTRNGYRSTSSDLNVGALFLIDMQLGKLGSLDAKAQLIRAFLSALPLGVN